MNEKNTRFSDIEKFVQSKKVAIYMKGTLDFPACGFSAQAIQTLRMAGVGDSDITTFDVLSDPEMRNAIKAFTNWPTVPQVFIKGKFIGGCDIVTEMYSNGELKELLGA